MRDMIPNLFPQPFGFLFHGFGDVCRFTWHVCQILLCLLRSPHPGPKDGKGGFFTLPVELKNARWFRMKLSILRSISHPHCLRNWTMTNSLSLRCVLRIQPDVLLRQIACPKPDVFWSLATLQCDVDFPRLHAF